MKKILLNLKVSLMALAFLGALVSCGPGEEPKPVDPGNNGASVLSVALDQTSLTIAIGESVDLKATVTPSNIAGSNVSWSSSDAAVASVTNGTVKGVKEGTTTVTVTAGGKTATCTVTVVKGGFPEGQVPPDNEIWYITSDGKPLEMFNMQGGSIVQFHKYSGGMGILHFHAPITEFHQLSESKEDCHRVTGLLLPDCVESFDQFSFYYGYSIKEFRIPAALKNLRGVPFTSIRGSATLERFTGHHVSEDGRCVIIDGALVGFAPAGISSYEIPDGVVKLGQNAFANASDLKSVVIPSSVKEIDDSCFGHSGLESVTIPASVTSIHPYAFHYCDNLRNLLGDSPFISADRKFLFDAHSYTPMTLFFFAGKDDSSYEIPEGIRGLEHYSFANCDNLRSVTFPSSLQMIQGEAFEGCDNIEAVYGSGATSDNKGYMVGGKLSFLVPKISDDYVVPEEVTALGDYLFNGRTTLHSVTMGDNVTSIGNYVFRDCTSLKTIIFSANLYSIGYHPFRNTPSVEAVYFRGVLPPSYNDKQFTEYPSMKFYVPSQSLSLYKSSICWEDYWDIITPYDFTDLPEPDFYLSKDYSKEGEVTVYQKASEGNGVDIVFLGDAYSDRQVENGMYLNDMKACAEEFFAIEPYKSFRHLFNIYFVTTVSATEGYERGGQSLGTVPGQITYISGNDGKCFELALKAVKDEKRMDEVLVVVCGNQDLSGLISLRGTCFMHDAEDWGGKDYANGPSVAYFMKLDDSFERTGFTLRHEAGGHGFAKLADEYSYSGSLQSMDYDNLKKYEPYRWYSNVDVTSDPEKVKWSVFLKDERYKNEVGVFEGAYTVAHGAWRPSIDSIMKQDRTNDQFNAPSRYTIWYRIHKLAYGPQWNGTFEDFAAYDAINRSTGGSVSHAPTWRSPLRRQNQQTTPPVVTGRTWRNAKKQ